MSEDYARRSIYRQQIVHGMLPVAFVSLLRILHQKGYSCLLRQLNCQFIEPVFIGDELALQGQLTDINEETGISQVKFTVTKRKNKVEALNGSIQVSFVTSSVFSASIPPASQVSQ